MLFKNGEQSIKFRLAAGLRPKEREEITKLITDNGGVVVHRTRNPLVMTFSNSDAILRPGEPLINIKYVRDCIRQHKVLQLVNYIIGPKGYFRYLQCIFTCEKNVCQLHYDGPSDFHPRAKTAKVDENIKQQKSSSPKHGEEGGKKSAKDAPTQRKVPAAVGTAAEKKNKEKSYHRTLRSPRNQEKSTASLIKQSPKTVKTTVRPTIDDGSITDDLCIDSSSASEDRVPLAGTSGKASPKKGSRKRKRRDIREIRRLRAPRRPNISEVEQRKIVRYLIDNDMISVAKGMKPWDKMVKDRLTRRSAETLNSHFRKILLPKIAHVPMSKQHLREFQKLAPKNTPPLQ